MDGILVVTKPGGMTSHDVVVRIRRAAGTKRVGHAGTLDPDATGVLVILVGRATAAMQFMVGMPKAYTAEMVLGITTDTQDASGKAVRVADAVDVSKERFLDALAGYTGEISQVPPMVSAVHHEGRRLYELAREGIEVERRPRRVRIYEIRVERWPDVPLAVGSRVTVRVTCSSGTYIRQLAADIGESLGCGAHLGSLVRTRVGPFDLASAHGLDEIEASAWDGHLSSLLVPVAAGLSHLPAVTVGGEDARRISTGAQIEAPGCVRCSAEPSPAPGEDDRGGDLVRVHQETGELLCVARVERSGARARLRPVRVFTG